MWGSIYFWIKFWRQCFELVWDQDGVGAVRAADKKECYHSKKTV